jgi:hypothetical protein
MQEKEWAKYEQEDVKAEKELHCMHASILNLITIAHAGKRMGKV